MNSVGTSSSSRRGVGGAGMMSNSSRKRKGGISPPTTLELRGIAIHFPFKPYKCQEEYMGKVLDALLRSENALLESPTGTGKTLCLLCAALAWQREHAKNNIIIDQQRQQQQQPISLKEEAPAAAAAAAATTTSKSSSSSFAAAATTTTAAVNNNNNNNNNSNNSNNNRRRHRGGGGGVTVPTIIYASRTHSQLSQVVRELRSTRYRPRHAVLGSREQMCVHPKVKKPNATSSDINHDCNTLNKERKCKYRNQLLDGKFPIPATDQNNQQPPLDMEDLVTQGKQNRICPFYYTRSILTMTSVELVLMPYNYLFDRDARETTLAEIDWNNAVVIFDEAHNLESFATESASFDLTQHDIRLCGFEVDRATNCLKLMSNGDDGDGDNHPSYVKKNNLTKMKAMFLRFEDYIKNLRQSGSFSGEYMMNIFSQGMGINYSNHHLFIDEVKKINELLLDALGGGGGKDGGRGNGISSSSRGAPKLEHFAQCLKRVFGEKTEAKCMAKAKSYRVHITGKGEQQQQQQQQWGARNNNNNNNKNGSSRTLSYWCFAPSLAMHELRGLNLRSIIVTSGTLSPLPSYSMELGLSFPHTIENPHIISDDQIHVRVIGKGVNGKELSSNYQRRQDADYYIELGNTLVSLAKVIPAGMLVFFPSYSVMETCLERWGGPISSNSRFNNYNNSKNKSGSSSFFAARNKKGKNSSNRQQYSFPYANPSVYGSSLGVSKNNPITPWKRLLATKSVVVEPRSTADLPDAISEFHRYLAMPKSKGVALFGICRGKISEGIDFSGDQSRAVIITGLPFPPAYDPKVKLKREYLDGAKASMSMKSTEAGGFGDHDSSNDVGSNNNKMEKQGAQPTLLSGAAWYNQQAHRACNQAVGRVIRNKDDYGAVLLLDSRFSLSGNQQGLSKWVRPHVQRDEGVGRAIASLAKFYRRAEAQAKEREEAKKAIILEYEPEEEQESAKKQKQEQPKADDAFTKVVFVQNQTRDLQVASASSNTQDTSSKIDDDADEPGSFIAPERVLARVDVDKLVEEKKRRALVEDQSKLSLSKAQLKPSSHKSVFASSAAQRMPMKPSTVNNVKSVHCGSNPKPKLDSKQAAQLFFVKAQKWMTKEEFSKIRKSCVAMKKHGDNKDTKAYLKSAMEIVSLCLQRESFFGQHEEVHEEKMLFLFFQVIPQTDRPKVEALAMAELFKKSSLGRLCKTNLPADRFKKLKAEFGIYLRLLWCDARASGSDEQQRKDFLGATEKVLALLQASNDEEVSSTLISAFAQSKLVPLRFKKVLEALLSDMDSQSKIQQMKSAEARNKGEGSIELIRFQRTEPLKTTRPKEPFAVKREPKEHFAIKKEPKEPFAVKKEPPREPQNLKVHSTLQTTKHSNTSKGASTVGMNGQDASVYQSSIPSSNKGAKTVNPYAKKTKSLSSYISKPPAAAPTEAARTAKSANRKPPNGAPPEYSRHSELASLGKSPTIIKRAPPAYDPVSSMLHQAESSPFARKTGSDVVATLSSHVPKNVQCQICDEAPDTPMLAECGHIACKACWLQWLERSNTCPTCRKAVELQSLARAVFQDECRTEYKESAPSFSLSQFCE